MPIFKSLVALTAVLASTADAATSVRGASKEEVVLKYPRSVSTYEILDAVEEAGASFVKQLECTRGMIVAVDAKGRRLLERKNDLLSVKTNPHLKASDPVPDFMKNRELQNCECSIDNGYVLTVDEVNKLKQMVRDNLVDYPDYDDPTRVCDPEAGEPCSCPFNFRTPRRNRMFPNTCVGNTAEITPRNPSQGEPGVGNQNVPLIFNEVGANSFDGSLADSAGALVRNAFHDCGTFDVRGNYELSGCNGCVDLTSDKNNGLQNANAFLAGIKQRATTELNPPIDVTMADLIILASTVAIEETIRRFNYVEAHDTLWDPTSAPEDIVPLGDFVQSLNIPFKYGRMDIPKVGDACPCEEDKLPGAEAVLVPSNGAWTREEIRQSMGDKYNFSMRELAALMGVHSLGKLEEKFSGYEGQWNFGAPDEFSNAFFAQSNSGRRLEKKQFVMERVMLLDNGDPNGPNKSVPVVTEWERGNNFIFLNSDITFLYDLSYKDENGNLCNVTDADPTDPDEMHDIVCPQFTDAAAQDYEDFGNGIPGYKRWLVAFSSIYRRMTDELVPCANPLQVPRGNPTNFNIVPGPNGP